MPTQLIPLAVEPATAGSRIAHTILGAAAPLVGIAFLPQILTILASLAGAR